MKTESLSLRWAALKARRQAGAIPAAQVWQLMETLRVLPETVKRLQTTGQMVEQATSKIMDECDRIRVCGGDVKALLEGLETPLEVDVMAALESALEEMTASVMRVYELCNFQDVNQQNQVRTMQVLSGIESRLQPMRAELGLVVEQENEAAKLQQGEIDSLLDTLKR
jgi:hypothetical protein